MIGFDEAIELIRSVAKPLGTEALSIADAAGRVLASPVVAEIDSPRSDVSGMDGYAVRKADLGKLPASLKVIGESFAGAGWNGSITSGACARVFTGAPVPDGADWVVMQENVCREGDFAIIDEHPGSPDHIRRRGSDFRGGDQLLAPGRLLDARAIVAAAAADVGTVNVYRSPCVHVLSTGDELAEPGTARSIDGAIPDSVSLGVSAIVQQWGGLCIGRRRLGDRLPDLLRAAESTVEASDLVVVTGGASVGEKDFAKAMFEPLGLELLFSKVAVRPGKPVWLGRVAGKLIIGLPGNPTSALVTARLFLAPLLALLTGRATEQALAWRTVPLASPLPQCGTRETFHRARLISGAAEILSSQDSSAQKALVEADLLVRQRAHASAVTPGELVQILDF